MNHRMPPDGTLEEKFALRHTVTLREGGPFHRLFGATQVMTNTLHGQGVKAAGRRFAVDGWAPDGTPEAAFVEGASGFTLSVQWHPEYRAAQDPVSRPLFEAFGAAVAAWASGQRTAVLRSA
jgi:putative glutamine amidotransferase